MQQQDFDKLRQFIFAYEDDPNHKINWDHINHRQHCVVTYGSDHTQQQVLEIYKEYRRDKSMSDLPCSSGDMRTKNRPQHKGGNVSRLRTKKNPARQIPRCNRH